MKKISITLMLLLILQVSTAMAPPQPACSTARFVVANIDGAAVSFILDECAAIDEEGLQPEYMSSFNSTDPIVTKQDAFRTLNQLIEDEWDESGGDWIDALNTVLGNVGC